MSSSYIHPTAEVDPQASLAEGVAIWNWSKACAGAVIGAGTKIGQCVYIDRNVYIGKGCKIQNGVSVYHGVTIQDDVFVGPNATFTNDRFPRAFSRNWTITETFVETGASIGANATIVCGVSLGKYCMVAAGATVTHNVPPHALVMGQPARIVDFVTRDGRRLHWNVENGVPSESLLSGE